MDNDPSQNSGPACQAMDEIEAKLHKIPPRSPDLNPTENIFCVLWNLLNDEAESCNITHETFNQFRGRVLRTLENIDIKLIDKTIKSMSKPMLSSPPKEVDQSTKKPVMRKALFFVSLLF